jgi:mono/diheme cytochrome c family protein
VRSVAAPIWPAALKTITKREGHVTGNRFHSVMQRVVAGVGTMGWLLTSSTGGSGSETSRYVQAPLPPPIAADPGHVHAPIPAAYGNAHIPARVWTDPKMVAKGKEIFVAKCERCHGERGDGTGPDAVDLSPKPADLTDAKMAVEMPGNFWFWRVSEGGLVEPYNSRGSEMPAWKGELSVSDRWAVIAYAHTLSGHAGPHTPSEHPEMARGHAH